VDVTKARLNTIAELFDSRKLVPQVGSLLPLRDAQVAHQMLAGAPHRTGQDCIEYCGLERVLTSETMAET
jgi:hypothetical protein